VVKNNKGCVIATFMYNITMIKVRNFKITQVSDGKDNSFEYQKHVLVPLPKIRVEEEERPDELSVTEFAEQAGITPQGVRKMISEDRLSALKLGKRYVINKEELVRYLQTQ